MYNYVMADPIDGAPSEVTNGLWLSCGSFVTSNILRVVPRSEQLKQLYSDLGIDCACGDKVI